MSFICAAAIWVGAIVQREREASARPETEQPGSSGQQEAGSWKAGLGSLHIVRRQEAAGQNSGAQEQETGGESEQWLAFIARSLATMSQWSARQDRDNSQTVA